MASSDERERRAQDRITQRISRRFERRMRVELSEAIREAADAHESSRSIDAAVAMHEDNVERLLRSMWESAFTAIGERVLSQLDDEERGLPWIGERKELPDSIQRALQSFIGRWGARKVTQITSATQSWIRGAISRGIEEGMSVPEIGSQIRGRATQIAAWRANTIARTETHSAAQNGSLQVAADSGKVRLKRWVPVRDGRTRQGDNSDFNHYSPDRGEVPVNEPFIISGEQLMHPGDPSGSAGNIINCFAPDTEIRGGIVAGTRSYYSGPVVTIITRRDSRLTVTPNHPVLTDRGFVAAGHVNKSQKLVAYSGGVEHNTLGRVGSINYQDGPAEIEKVFQAIDLVGRRERRVVAQLDFHGDGHFGDGDIDIVHVNRVLAGNAETKSREHFDNLGFISTNLTLTGHGDSPLRLSSHSAASSGLPCSTTLPNNSGSVALHERPFDVLGFGLSPQLNALLYEVALNAFAADAVPLRQLVDRRSVDITMDDIVDIQRGNFRGHVYDLQSNSGVIIANNIIAHNCRCAMTYVTR